MKFFAVAALMATTTAVRLSAEAQGPPSWEDVLEVLDSDDSGTVSWGEIMDFVKEMEKQHGEKMPEEMKKDLKKMFDYVDKDGSGDIDKAEFEAAVKAHGAMGQKTRKGFSQLLAQQGPPSWEDVLEVLDSDGSGTVSWEEIMDFVKEMEKQHGQKMPEDMKKDLKKMFDYVDKDGSGDIDKAEFEAAIKAHGAMGQKTRKGFSQLLAQKGGPSWEELLEMLDSDGSGTISWGEVEDFLHAIEEEHNKMWDEMKQEVKKMFEYIDADGSGDVDKAEFEAAVKGHGALAQNARKTLKKMLAQKGGNGAPSWEELLEMLDSDGSGTISWGEVEDFLHAIEEHYNEEWDSMKQDVKAMFEYIDADGSGDVDKAEFEAAVQAHGALAQKSKKTLKKMLAQAHKGGPPSWEDVLEVLDEDGSGTVSWDEIVSFIKKVEKEHNVKISKEDKKAIKAAFEQVDTDGSGDIDKAEFEAALKAMEGLAQLKKYM